MKPEVAFIYQTKFDNAPRTYPHSGKIVEGSKQTITLIMLFTVPQLGGEGDSINPISPERTASKRPSHRFQQPHI